MSEGRPLDAQRQQQPALGSEPAHRVTFIVGEIDGVVRTDVNAMRADERDVGPGVEVVPLAVEHPQADWACA